LLGGVDSSTVTQNALIETGGRYKTNATYVQDNIQLTPSLTVNVGLRWDVWTPFHETLDRQTFFNPNLPNPVAGGILGGLMFAGHGPDSCGCGTPVLLHWHELGPRFGFAYKINNTTVIRGAYDIFYSHAGGVGGRTNGRQGLSQIGYDNSGSLGSTVTGQPAYSWDGGYPGNPINPPFFNPSYGIGFIVATQPGAAAIGAGPSTAQTLVYGDPKKGGQAPQYQDFFFNIQHSFGQNTTLSVAYSGSVGRYLPGAGVAGPYTNQIPLQYLPLGSLLTTTLSSASIASSQALGFTVVSPFPGFTGTIGQALKPYPQYSSLSDPWLDVGTSSYNSLQVTLNRRISNGLTFMVNYTLSKEEDDLAGVRVPGEDYLEYSVGALDRKHVLQSTFVYKLPFGAGRRFNTSNAVVDGIAGGWQIAGIFTANSGAPISVGGVCTGGGIIDASCYPNTVSGVGAKISGKPTSRIQASTTQYVNPAAFVLAPNYTYGNAARTAPDGLFAPTSTDLDINVRKEFPLLESATLSTPSTKSSLPLRTHPSVPRRASFRLRHPLELTRHREIRRVSISSARGSRSKAGYVSRRRVSLIRQTQPQCNAAPFRRNGAVLFCAVDSIQSSTKLGLARASTALSERTRCGRGRRRHARTAKRDRSLLRPRAAPRRHCAARAC
jgi:hypothetical protein